MQDLAGTAWKLIESSASDEHGNQLPPPWGPSPIGFVMFEADRMIVAVVDGRPSMPPDAPPRRLSSYSGLYRFDGTELKTTAYAASSSDLLGQQVRHIRFDSPTRMTITPKNTVHGYAAGLTLVWQRIG